MLYIPDSFIDDFGGLDRVANTEEFEKFKDKILDRDVLENEIKTNIKKHPVRIKGSMSYVE